MSFLSPIARLARQRTVFCIASIRKPLHNSACLFKQIENEEKPVKFSTSKAAGSRLQMEMNRLDDRPPYQTPIILLSFVIMMIYFIFREPNDFDELLTMDGSEKDNIKKLIIFNEKRGLKIKALEERLAEIEAAEQKAKSKKVLNKNLV